jgi:beta-ribofuranosylaminobenzene 5'-phosphate synthase
MRSRIEIDAPARVHLGLIGMGSGGPRINGGIGFAIEGFAFSVGAVGSHEIRVVDERTETALSTSELRHLESLICSVCHEHGLKRLPEIKVKAGAPSHSGLGAGTAIRLAALEATFVLNGIRMCEPDLVKSSRRGGTSGVGVHTYFEGGLTVDLGHKARGGHRPSHAWVSPSPPLHLARVDMPSWRIGICRHPSIPSLTHEQEREIFKSTTPVADDDVNKTLFVALFGVFAAAAEADRTTFVESIDQLQSSAWKAAEWQAHGTRLLEIRDRLSSAGARGIGLSSMGPTVVFMADGFDAGALDTDLRCSVKIVEPRNKGRKVVVDGVETI